MHSGITVRPGAAVAPSDCQARLPALIPSAFSPQLSYLLRTQPSVSDRGKINAASRNIAIISSIPRAGPPRPSRPAQLTCSLTAAHIDQLPAPYRLATVLYLGGNNIRHLDGLSQFPNLRTLGLANNLVGAWPHLGHPGPTQPPLHPPHIAAARH